MGGGAEREQTKETQGSPCPKPPQLYSPQCCKGEHTPRAGVQVNPAEWRAPYGRKVSTWCWDRGAWRVKCCLEGCFEDVLRTFG